MWQNGGLPLEGGPEEELHDDDHLDDRRAVVEKRTNEWTEEVQDTATQTPSRNTEAVRRAQLAMILSDAALDPERYIANYDAGRGAE
ncbi:MAG TPA: hypothetical protein VK116_07485 [Planctomycetota bacterium]|nr:hypothetical protein [Planctomycetota bacterium]